ncbi:MAG: phage holin family protein [Candidatus Saccharimonadales bacterium]
MKNQGFFIRFLLRWGMCTLGLWIAAAILGDNLTYDGRVSVLIIAGLILAAVNSVIKPIAVLFALPAVLLTLGLFMLVINALMVMLVAWLYTPLEVSGFWSAMLAGLIIGVVNFLVSVILEDADQGKKAKRA